MASEGTARWTRSALEQMARLDRAEIVIGGCLAPEGGNRLEVALEAVDGVIGAHVDVRAGLVTIAQRSLQLGPLLQAIEDAGFRTGPATVFLT